MVYNKYIANTCYCNLWSQILLIFTNFFLIYFFKKQTSTFWNILKQAKNFLANKNLKKNLWDFDLPKFRFFVGFGSNCWALDAFDSLSLDWLDLSLSNIPWGRDQTTFKWIELLHFWNEIQRSPSIFCWWMSNKKDT